jgi:DNA replication protein DnaC
MKISEAIIIILIKEERMNNQATIEKMQDMRLHGMLRAFKELNSNGSGDSLTPDEMLAHLIEAEEDYRYNRKLDSLMKNAHFRYKASIVEVDFSPIRKINKNNFMRLSQCGWIEKGESIIIIGATGAGKSFIACALGHQACIHKYRVAYHNCLKLFSALKYAKADGTYFKEIKNIKKQELLILDDFGLKKMDTDSRLMLLEILEDRHGSKSTIISTQIPIKKWFDVIGDPTIADAICDRVIHSSHKIDIEGPSMRKVNSKCSGQKLPPEK